METRVCGSPTISCDQGLALENPALPPTVALCPLRQTGGAGRLVIPGTDAGGRGPVRPSLEPMFSILGASSEAFPTRGDRSTDLRRQMWLWSTVNDFSNQVVIPRHGKYAEVRQVMFHVKQ
jgi:hypothetical protein